MSYGNISVTTSATLIVAENKRRTSLLIYNNGTAPVFWGLDASVNVNNGMPLAQTTKYDLNIQTDKMSLEQTLYTGPIYGIAGTTQDVRFVEFDDVTNVRQL